MFCCIMSCDSCNCDKWGLSAQQRQLSADWRTWGWFEERVYKEREEGRGKTGLCVGQRKDRTVWARGKNRTVWSRERAGGVGPIGVTRTRHWCEGEPGVRGVGERGSRDERWPTTGPGSRYLDGRSGILSTAYPSVATRARRSFGPSCRSPQVKWSPVRTTTPRLEPATLGTGFIGLWTLF